MGGPLCCDVLCRMMSDCSCCCVKPRCCDFRKIAATVGYFLLYSFIALFIAGCLYLYIVPFTNVIGMQLFADYRCTDSTGVWGVCGRSDNDVFDPNGTNVRVGFFVFIIIQITVGFIILASFLNGCSRRKGRIVKYHCVDLWCHTCTNIVDDDPSQEYWERSTQRQDYCLDDCCQFWQCFCCIDTDYQDEYCPMGPCLAYAAIWLYGFATLVVTIFVGVWGGRAIAVRVLPQCQPFIDTSIGLYGCISNSNFSTITDPSCVPCAGYGFGILGVPLLVFEIIGVILWLSFISCRRKYIATKAAILRERQAAAEAIEVPVIPVEKQEASPANHDFTTVVPPLISMVDQQICVICEENRALHNLPCCNHTICDYCAKNTDGPETLIKRCPFCRTKYEYSKRFILK